MTWGVESSFPDIYEEMHIPGYFRSFTRALLEHAAPVPGERILDVATGTGIVVREAHERVPGLGRLTGLDLTPAMLTIARQAAPHAEWVDGDATQLPFEDGAFDLVTCQQGLQFFPDRGAALREMRRVLAPGGRAVVACWCAIESAPYVKMFADVLVEHAPEIAPAARNPFVLHDADELRALVESAGFAAVTVETITADAVYDSAAAFARAWAYGTPTAIPFGKASPEVQQRVLDGIVERIAPLEDADGIRYPMSTLAAVGRAQ